MSHILNLYRKRFEDAIFPLFHDICRRFRPETFGFLISFFRKSDIFVKKMNITSKNWFFMKKRTKDSKFSGNFTSILIGLKFLWELFNGFWESLKKHCKRVLLGLNGLKCKYLDRYWIDIQNPPVIIPLVEIASLVLWMKYIAHFGVEACEYRSRGLHRIYFL